MIDWLIRMEGLACEVYLKASEIYEDNRDIENYLKSDDYGSKKLEILTQLPKIATDKILIVGDDQAISNLIGAIFPESDIFDVAADGQEALQKLHTELYNRFVFYGK